jgi:coatomer subunit alpha
MQVIPKLPNATRPPVMRSISYNPAENALLINSDEEGGTYRFFKLAGGAPASLVSRGEVPEAFSGQGGTAVFIARNRFAVWNRFTSTIQVRPLLPAALRAAVLKAPGFCP